MNAIKYIFKSVVWSATVNIIFRVMLGMYSVFGPPILIVSAAIGVYSAFILSGTGNRGLTSSAVFHMILVTGFQIMFDLTVPLRMLPLRTADLLGRIVGGGAGINILWCILFVMPVYFFIYIISSAFISASRKRRMLREEAELSEDDEWYGDEDNCTDENPSSNVRIFKKR